jgi:hypothetical protein
MAKKKQTEPDIVTTPDNEFDITVHDSADTSSLSRPDLYEMDGVLAQFSVSLNRAVSQSGGDGVDRPVLQEIATYDTSQDYYDNNILLPDPDQVCSKAGYVTYDWMTVLRFLLTDPHVWACYQSRKAATLGREWEIVEGRYGTKPDQFKLIKSWFESLDVRQVISDILDAPFFGHSPLEVIWAVDDLYWWPESIVGRPPEWFAYDYQGNLRYLSRAALINGELLPPKKFLLARHHANYYNPFGERLLSRCFWPITFKRASLKFWAIFIEKYGMPWAVGKVSRGTPQKEREALLSELAKMVQDAVGVINDDESVEFMNDKIGGRGDVTRSYEGLTKQADTQISKAILGQSLTTDSGQDGSGSYALGKVHSDVRADLVESDARIVEYVMNTLLAWVTSLNFNTNAPEFRFYEEEAVQRDLAERDEKLVNTGLRFTREYYEDKYNLDPSWVAGVVDPKSGEGGGQSVTVPGGPSTAPYKLSPPIDLLPAPNESGGRGSGAVANPETNDDDSNPGQFAEQGLKKNRGSRLRRLKSVRW